MKKFKFTIVVMIIKLTVFQQLYSQSLNFNELINIINTDNKTLVVNFLESKSFIREKTNDGFEYYKYNKFGKYSNDSENGRIVLFTKAI